MKHCRCAHQHHHLPQQHYYLPQPWIQDICYQKVGLAVQLEAIQNCSPWKSLHGRPTCLPSSPPEREPQGTQSSIWKSHHVGLSLASSCEKLCWLAQNCHWHSILMSRHCGYICWWHHMQCVEKGVTTCVVI